jgi:hypothetical protein
MIDVFSSEQQVLNGPVSEFSLCLSRACLGKMFVFIHKWLKKTVVTSGWLPPPSPSGRRRTARKRYSFLSLIYVCPEPVLAK